MISHPFVQKVSSFYTSIYMPMLKSSPTTTTTTYYLCDAIISAQSLDLEKNTPRLLNK